MTPSHPHFQKHHTVKEIYTVEETEAVKETETGSQRDRVNSIFNSAKVYNKLYYNECIEIPYRQKGSQKDNAYLDGLSERQTVRETGCQRDRLSERQGEALFKCMACVTFLNIILLFTGIHTPGNAYTIALCMPDMYRALSGHLSAQALMV